MFGRSILYQASPLLPGILFLVHLLGNLGVGVVLFLRFQDASAAEYFWGTMAGFGGVNLIAGLSLGFIRRASVLRAVLALRLVLVVLLAYTLADALEVTAVLLGIFLVDAGVCTAQPWGFLLGTAALVLGGLPGGLDGIFGRNLLVATPGEPGLWSGGAGFGILLGVILMLSALAGGLLRRYNFIKRLTDQQETNLQRLSEFNLSLQSYARRADEQSAERERRRISREIHDISGYIFTNLIAMMDATMSLGPDADISRVHATLMTARKQAQEGLRETRTALRRLREVDPYGDKGLRMIYKIAGVFQQVTGTRVELSFGNLPLSFDTELNRSLYRIVQESLTNAIRHGKATEVGMQFWIHEEHLIITIHDNGAGAKEITKGIGLAGMEERLKEMGGSIKAGNAPEGGFTLTIRIPLEQQGSTYRARKPGQHLEPSMDSFANT